MSWIRVIGQNSFTNSWTKERLPVGGQSGGSVNPDFVSTWDTTQAGSASDTVVLPLQSGGTYNGTIDWGDGNSDSLSYANRTHVYASSGTYTITISGDTFEGWKFNGGGDRRKILDISNWGFLNITTDNAFNGCANLDISATDYPTISTNSFYRIFFSCTSLTTPDFSGWDVSNVTNMQAAFRNCTSFNGDVSTWDVSSVTNFGQISYGAPDGMFAACNSFNSDITNWNTSSATKMYAMFQGCTSFNQDISGWDVSSVSDMQYMFAGCSSFNQPIHNWTPTSLTQIAAMFVGATIFNQPIDSWAISPITSGTNSGLYRTFKNAQAFNQDLNSWNVSGVTNMQEAFAYATSFNGDITLWDVSNVTSFGRLAFGQSFGMFLGASSFNQDIGNWDTSSGTDFHSMLSGTTSFDQSLAGFDLTSATRVNISPPNLSTANYDATLIGWESILDAAYPGGVGYPYTPGCNFGSTKYTSGGAAEAARTSLITNFGWTITDGGGV
jgi:surface protein